MAKDNPVAEPVNCAPLIAAPGPLAIRTYPAHPRNYSAATTRTIDFVVLHCTDGHRGTHKDTDVGAMFARADLQPRRSCHYVVDSDSVTQCVADMSRAWHCGRRGNALGVGVEFCGRARHTRAQWLDELGRPMLELGARLVAELCALHRLPPRFVDAPALRARLRGVTTHAEIGEAWRQTTHTDPGVGFPLDEFLAAVRGAMASARVG